MKFKLVLPYFAVLLLGFLSVFLPLKFFLNTSQKPVILRKLVTGVGISQPQVVGFLPYWLLERADKDYTSYLTTLTYFGLTVDEDGTIQKYTNPGEAEPGWYALSSGKADDFLKGALINNLKLSLTVFNGNQESIGNLLDNPVLHASTLVDEVAPLMRKYHFSDLNLDIESVADASDGARENFSVFVKTVKDKLTRENLGTLTIDISPTDLIKKRLVDFKKIVQFIDYAVIMAYDYHFTGSLVTGPVAPVGGVGKDAEFDAETGIQKALEIAPGAKLILGVPLYGYQWETLTSQPRSAVLPGSGLINSNRLAEEFIANCATCSVQFDETARENFLIYKDQETETYHQIFFPGQNSLAAKITLSQKYNLSGLALWAIGYEGKTILTDLEGFKNGLR